MKHSIYLVGFMGSGKSTVGRVLADRLGRPFVDLDEWIEARMGSTIAELFCSEGEAYFRRVEKDSLRQLVESQGIVAALGGGTPMAPENRATIREHATTVWLEVPAPLAWARCAQETHRPLANDRKEFERLLEERTSIYREADIHVRCLDREPDAIVDEITKKLKEWAHGLDKDRPL